MEKILSAYLANPDEGDFKLTFSVGDEKSGQTEFILYGDAGYRLWSTQTQGKKKEEYAGYRDIAEVTATIEKLKAAGIQVGNEGAGNAKITLAHNGEILSVSDSSNADATAFGHGLKAIYKLIQAIAGTTIQVS